MIKLITTIILMLFTLIINAQIVNIPDINFKNALLNHNPVIDTNNDGEIQVTEAENTTSVSVNNNNISDLTGIEAFINTTLLSCSDNNITILDLNSNVNLVELICSRNQVITLNLTNNINLETINCSRNDLTSLIVNTTLTNNVAYIDCSFNQLSSLDVSNINFTIEGLYCNNNNLTSLILNNTITEYLVCRSNQLSNLDLTQLTVTKLYCGINNLGTLDLSNNVELQTLDCHNNLLTSLDLSQNNNLTSLITSFNQIQDIQIDNLINLQTFNIENNEISDIDISSNPNLILIYFDNNPNLNYLNLKNGNNQNTFVDAGHNGLSINNCPNVEVICVDAINSDFVLDIMNTFSLTNTFTKYCSLEPAQTNQINGNVKLDLDSNGCNENDLPMPNLMLITDNGTETFATFTQNNGDYLLYTNEGSFITEVTTLPSYFTVNPNAQTNTFTGFDNTFTANFCIESNQTINDVNITILPLTTARPGIEAKYKLVYKNVGTTVLSGSVSLDFDNVNLDFLSASETISSQTSSNVTFNYVNLNPFESRTITLIYNVSENSNLDDILNFTATINPISGDYTPDDNTIDYDQTIVNSYDPNDIHILEGPHIKIQDKDDYIHYLIRFQNTGTAEAFNVVVTNKLNENLDWTTLQLENTSHSTRVAIHNGNDIEFIFEDINLPDSTNDEPNSHGYIAYKIKLKNNIIIGDIIPNQAKIFFDLNEAINTNIASTEIIDNNASINDNELANAITIHPNPTYGLLNFDTKNMQIINLKIYSSLGQLILIKSENNIKQIDLKELTKGLYFLKIENKSGNFAIKKVILE